VAAMISAMLGGVRIDRHAADRIDRATCRCVVVVTPLVMLRRHARTLSQIPPGGI
jgi:hypothetical protein